MFTFQLSPESNDQKERPFEEVTLGETFYSQAVCRRNNLTAGMNTLKSYLGFYLNVSLENMIMYSSSKGKWYTAAFRSVLSCIAIRCNHFSFAQQHPRVGPLCLHSIFVYVGSYEHTENEIFNFILLSARFFWNDCFRTNVF